MKRHDSTSHLLTRGLAILVAACGIPGTLHAATRYAAINGIDTGACGFTSATACRTISQAITNAAAGDTIVVGPGVYGDVDRDGMLEPGEEAGGLVDGNDVTIRIAKSLTVVSRDGSGSTEIAVPAGSGDRHAVGIDAPDVTFGLRNKGFSIVPAGPDSASGSVAVYVNAGDAVVEGNVVSCERRLGSAVNANGNAVTIRYNRIRQCNDSSAIDRVAEGAVVGNVIHGGEVRGLGILTLAASQSLLVEKNLIVGNADRAISIQNVGATVLVQSNLLIGNYSSAVRVSPSAAGITLAGNSIFGNDSGGNCGLLTSASDVALAAGGNYWGSPAGPGADPADAICDTGAFASVTAPVATVEAKVKALPLR